jgi:hypothetical protein
MAEVSATAVVGRCVSEVSRNSQVSFLLYISNNCRFHRFYRTSFRVIIRSARQGAGLLLSLHQQGALLRLHAVAQREASGNIEHTEHGVHVSGKCYCCRLSLQAIVRSIECYLTNNIRSCPGPCDISWR